MPGLYLRICKINITNGCKDVWEQYRENSMTIFRVYYLVISYIEESNTIPDLTPRNNCSLLISLSLFIFYYVLVRIM